MRRSVREGAKPYDGHARAGEVGLRRSTGEPAEQGGNSFCGGWGGKGAAEGEHHSTAHAPDSEQEFCMSQRLDGVREANRSLGFALRHSFFRRAVCVNALVRICAGGDP
jgi:hypothetical protein